MFFPESDFVKKTPHEMGISEAAISRALARIAASHKDIHSMLILRDGALVFEHYFDPYTADKAHAMYSCSKTFTSMCVGIAVGKGLLKLTDRVVDFFPDVPYENTENLQKMTIHDLLCMGSGHGEDTFGHMLASGGNWPSVFLNQVVDYAPGGHFVYNTGATYMLSAILTRVTGRSTLDLADEWIFRKIGIERPVWLTCPDGVPQGGTGLYLKPRDLARLGLLIANDGVWKGEQVVPADYIAKASGVQIDNTCPNNVDDDNWHAGYGYQMWRCAFGAFRADGMGGQYIVMMPEKGLVFVFTSALGGDIAFDLHVIEDELLPGVSDGPVAEEPIVYPAPKRLDEALLPELGATYAFSPNAGGLKSLRMDAETVTLAFDEETVHVPYGVGCAKLSNQSFKWMGWATAAPVMTTVWSEDKLYIRINEFGEPATMLFAIERAGDVLKLEGGFTSGVNQYTAEGTKVC